MLLIINLSNLSAQSNFAIVKPNGTTTIANSYREAIELASSGDAIYLPNGIINTEGVVIDKTLHIIGAGYNPDSSGNTTTLLGRLNLHDGASGGSITGVYFGDNKVFIALSDTSKVTNFTFFRCWFGCGGENSSFYLSPKENRSLCENITFKECVFIFWWIYLGYAQNILFEKCVICDRLFYINGTVSIKNCDLMMRSPSWPLFNSSTGVQIINSIILQVDNIHCARCNFINTIFTKQPTNLGDGATHTNCVFDFDTTNLFVRDFYQVWGFERLRSLKDYLHLKPQAKAFKGTDGTEVGIYGTSEPFKDGALPPIPVIKEAKISTRTNARGKLDVEFRIKAETK